MDFQHSKGKSQFHLLRNNYQRIRNCKLLVDKTLYDDNIEEFQQLLNESQPTTDQEMYQRSMVQFLYRKNPSDFCQFLARSGLNSFVLWTEAKSIVMHFGLKGVVYVKWDNDSNSYVCSLHKNVLNSDDSPKKSYDNIGRRDVYRGNSRSFNTNKYQTDRNDRGNGRYAERYYDRVDNRGPRRERNRYRNQDPETEPENSYRTDGDFPNLDSKPTVDKTGLAEVAPSGLSYSKALQADDVPDVPESPLD
jgi:hypothetical protein